MKIPVLESCCFCVPLKTGAKVVAFISVLGCILILISTAYEMVFLLHYVAEEYHGTFIVEAIIDSLMQATQIGTSILLLLGAYQGKRQFIPPWLVTTVINIFVEIFFMPSLVGRWVGVAHEDGHLRTLTFITLVDDVYGWIVVFSYYHTISPPAARTV